MKKNARSGSRVKEAIEYLQLRKNPQEEVTVSGYLVATENMGKQLMLQLAEEKGQVASAFNCFCRFDEIHAKRLEQIESNTAITVSGKLGQSLKGITLSDCTLIMINKEGKDMYLPAQAANY